jgi:hypothetical protein
MNLRKLSPPNGPELSCGDVQPDFRSMLARVVMCYHLVNSCRAAQKHAVFSVSLSEWLASHGIFNLCQPNLVTVLCLLVKHT